MKTYADRVRVTTATVGTGPVSLGAAVAKRQGFAAAAVPDGAEVRYTIEEGSAWEIGTGIYASAGPTLSRSLEQSSTGALLNLGGAAEVAITFAAADILTETKVIGLDVALNQNTFFN